MPHTYDFFSPFHPPPLLHTTFPSSLRTLFAPRQDKRTSRNSHRAVPYRIPHLPEPPYLMNNKYASTDTNVDITRLLTNCCGTRRVPQTPPPINHL